MIISNILIVFSILFKHRHHHKIIHSLQGLAPTGPSSRWGLPPGFQSGPSILEPFHNCIYFILLCFFHFICLFLQFTGTFFIFLWFPEVAPVYWNLFEIIFDLFLESPQYTGTYIHRYSILCRSGLSKLEPFANPLLIKFMTTIMVMMVVERNIRTNCWRGHD